MIRSIFKQEERTNLVPVGETPAMVIAKELGVSPVHMSRIKKSGLSALDDILPNNEAVASIYRSIEKDTSSFAKKTVRIDMSNVRQPDLTYCHITQAFLTKHEMEEREARANKLLELAKNHKGGEHHSSVKARFSGIFKD